MNFSKIDRVYSGSFREVHTAKAEATGTSLFASLLVAGTEPVPPTQRWCETSPREPGWISWEHTQLPSGGRWAGEATPLSFEPRTLGAAGFTAFAATPFLEGES